MSAELRLEPEPEPTWTSGSLLLKLKARFDPRQWAFFSEVPNGTGAKSDRRADALAMNLWPSGGLELHGFELKVSRGDWLRELRQPDKASPVKRYCDHWWLVVSGDDVVRSDPMPPGWGLMVVRHGDLVIDVPAPSLSAEPLDRAFVAALVRKICRGEA